MGRKKIDGLDILFSVANSAIKANKAYNRSNNRSIATQQRVQKSYNLALERIQKQKEKNDKIFYQLQRENEAIAKGTETNNRFQYLNLKILSEVINTKLALDFEELKPKFSPPILELPEFLQVEYPEPIQESYILAVGKSPILGFIIKSKRIRWQNKIETAKDKFMVDLSSWKQKIDQRKSDIAKFQNDFEKKVNNYKNEFEVKCHKINTFKDNYFAFEIEAVISYFTLVLTNSKYRISWEKGNNIAYSNESKEMIIDFKLPNIDIIPLEKDYKYIKSTDYIEPKYRKKTEIDSCYKSLISGIALRTIYEIFKSDAADSISILTFNGVIDANNLQNGKCERRTIISILISRSEYETIEFSNIEPISCIQGLSAAISPSPHELIAIKPIREFSMIDKRFVEEENVISKLDNRPNLMDLNPFEFENLVSNLFSQMGLETKQTRTSKDGGVDAIAFDKRPVIGGKIIIQAKRYKNTVGVSAVRDLYGTLLNEGGCKGILVTTSTYGSDAYVFSKNKPIELIDGAGLLYLLKQVGINAKIIMPDV